MTEPTQRDVLGTSIAAAAEALPTFRFPMEEQTPRTGEGGTAREASAAQFPVSKGIAGVSMTLAAGTTRELHWHANAAEWAYVQSGNCRITLYSPGGAGETADFSPGDVWYFPRGHGHSI
jgi:oxalate decarboxylase